MALITITCTGNSWQEDFPQVVPNLEYIFKRYFTRPDREEKVHEATLFFMESFARHWKQGETIRLTTNFSVLLVRRGATFVRKGNGGRYAVKSVKAKNNKPALVRAIKAKMDLTLAWIDYRWLIDDLPERDRRVVEMAMEGYSQSEIKRRLHIRWDRIPQIVQYVVSRLQQ